MGWFENIIARLIGQKGNTNMPKIKDLNPSAVGRIGGSDLAIPFKMPPHAVHGQEIGYMWGDTFDGDQPALNSGPDWRSPVLTIAKDDPVQNPINFIWSPFNGQQCWPYPHNNGEFTTVLPCDVLALGDRLYMWVMVTNGLANEIRCEMHYSDDRGEHWAQCLGGWQMPDGSPRWSTSFNGGQRVMITWADGGDGWIYIISTGGLARNKNACLWRAPATTVGLEDPMQWQARQYVNGVWQWGMGTASNILPAGAKLGEIGLRKIQGHWVFSGFDAAGYRAFVKVGHGPIENINWGTAPTTYPVRGNWQGSGTYDIVDRLYGCYVHPSSKFKNADGTTGVFTMVVSTWAQSGNPYRAMQYRIPTPAPTGPVVL